MMSDAALTSVKDAGIAGAQHTAIAAGALATGIVADKGAAALGATALAKAGVGRTIASAVAGPIATVGTIGVSAWTAAYHSATTGESNIFHQGAGAIWGAATGHNIATGEEYSGGVGDRLRQAGTSLFGYEVSELKK